VGFWSIRRWQRTSRVVRRIRRGIKRGTRRSISSMKRIITRKISKNIKKYHKIIHRKMKSIEEDTIVSKTSRQVFKEMEDEMRSELEEDGTGELREALKAEIHYEVVKHLADLKQNTPDATLTETRNDDEELER